ncbi:MAG: UvrD-helicase domain-containing protein [Bacteroidota bacterium]
MFPENKLTIISAGAGSGKTYRLTHELVHLLESGQVRADGIIATTFTNKAAAELQERVRLKLLEEGLSKEADDLTNALIGTVHGLGVKLLKRFAYEAGVSPEVSILADEDQQHLFNLSLSNILTEEKVIRVEQLCDVLGLSDNQYYDWRKEVKTITDIARSNDFGVNVLEESKVLSVQSFNQLLGEQDSRTLSSFHDDLLKELDEFILKVSAGEDATKATQDVLGFVKFVKNELKLTSKIKWTNLAKLSKLKTGAKSKQLVTPIIELAATHHSLTAFRNDIEKFTYLLFDLAIEAIQEFEQYKKQRGLIDYIDMEVLIKNLLKNEHVKEVLSDELDLLMVDEFQDTSPIQLEIFLELSKIANQSIWVGDPKQSIYGFRGADPKLMQEIIQFSGGINPKHIQKYSWRSREDIVFATNALFTKAFPDLPQEQVVLQPKRTKLANEDSANKEDEPIEMGHALIHWHFKYITEAKRKKQPGKPWVENCIANSIKSMLDHPPTIIPKGSNGFRTALPSDIAILCRSNSACLEVAEALSRAGIKVSISRSGLLNTAEATLVLACLKLLLNRNDLLSKAELLKLADGKTLNEIIDNRLAYQALNQTESYKERWAEESQFIQKVNTLRERTLELSTTELLELILEDLDIRRIVVGWGNATQRLDNIDALRQLGNKYEENCNRLHAPSSLGGFLLYLSDLANEDKDQQGSGLGEDAIQVLTYHKSKGLEWPIVICHNLEQRLRADVFGADIVYKTEEVDLDNLLGNRWLRYWVNPYGKQIRKTHLDESLKESEVQAEKQKQALQEEARLLYVGITRARDYLIFPTSENPTFWLNRTWHEGDEAAPTLDPDQTESPWMHNNTILPIDNFIFEYSKEFEIHPGALTPTPLFEPSAGILYHKEKYYDLRKEKLTDLYTWEIDDKGMYASMVLLNDLDSSYTAARLLKVFINAYHKDYSEDQLQLMAEELLPRFEAEDVIEPFEVVHVTKRFFNHFNQQFPGITSIKRNSPITFHHKGRIFSTVLDLVLETEEGIIIIQHSSFSGDAKNRIKRAAELNDWCYMVQKSLKAIHKQPIVRTYVHFVMMASLLEVSIGA